MFKSSASIFIHASCLAFLVIQAGCTLDPSANDNGEDETKTLLIFHNNSGPMCLAALDWLADVQSEYPDLVIEEHLTYDPGQIELLEELEVPFQESQGVSTSFAYLPIVFFEGQAFSGFDDEIADALEELMSSQEIASAGSTTETTNHTVRGLARVS